MTLPTHKDFLRKTVSTMILSATQKGARNLNSMSYNNHMQNPKQDKDGPEEISTLAFVEQSVL